MEKKRRKYGFALLWALIVLIPIAALVLFRAVVPKANLASALDSVYAQLETRFAEDPLLTLAGCYDPQGRYTAEMEMEAHQALLGTVVYDMTVSLDQKSHAYQGVGTARTSGGAMDLSFYLNPDFMAVSSGELGSGNYYGITYDSFTTDIQKVPLLNLIVNDELLARWDASVQSIQNQVRRKYTVPQPPTLSRGEFKSLLLGIAALPCKRQNADIILNEVMVSCDKLDYTVTGEQVAKVLSQLTGERYGTDTAGVLSFYLWEDALVRAALSGTTGDTPFQYTLDLGMNPAQNPLTLQGSYGSAKSLAVTVTTQRSENRYAESWDIRTVSNGREKDGSFAFDWASDSGVLTFRSGAVSAPLSLNFQKTENGVRLKTEDLSEVLRILQKEETPSPGASKIPCTVVLSKGGEIAAPSYKNLDQWTTEDFMTLLGGIGSLIGIKME